MEMNLSQMVAKIENTKAENYTRFEFGAPAEGNYFRKLASALAKTNEDLRRAFIVRLVKLWSPKGGFCLADTDEWKELEMVFGAEIHDISNFIGLRLVFTLTCPRDGGLRELRCWYGYPARYSDDHVDGADSGMLFSLTTNYAEARAILNEVQDGRFKDSLNFIELKNSVRIYGIHLY